MLRSMTGYGKASLHTELGYFVVEIVSINRKHLDLQLVLPEELVRFEGDIRRWLTNSIYRGRVTLKLTAVFEGETPLKVEPNLQLAHQMKEAWDAVATSLGLTEKAGFNLNMLRDVDGILQFENALDNESQYTEALQEVVKSGLEKLIERKRSEGAFLQKDIQHRLDRMAEWISEIAKRAPQATERYREKLRAKIAEVVPGQAVENEERVLRELVVYSDKVDISEEITRFESHLAQFRQILDSKAEDVGKTLEFIVQEMFREATTMAAKTDEVEVSRSLVLIRTELEKIREQIQNVE